MSKKDAALKMAIISFEAIMKAGLEDTQAEILQCKEALEQPEENDQYWYNKGYGQGKFDALMDAELKNPAQEPVAWIDDYKNIELKLKQ